MEVKGMIWCPTFLLIHIASCTVTVPPNFPYSVGDNIALNWTASKSILQVRFGLYDSSTGSLSQQFVLVNTIAGVQYTNLTNTAAARYAGRVKYVGNLTLGHAWFNLKDLRSEDFNEVYATRIREFGDASETSYPVNLTKRVIVPSPSPTLVPSSSTLPSSATPKTPTIPQPPKKKPWWLFILLGIIVILGLLAGIVVGCYCCCPKKLEDCYNRLCCCCPCKTLKDCYDRLCCCCPCKMKDHGSSEEQGSEMKS